MKNRRILSLLLVVLSIFLLVSCSKSESTTTDKSSTTDGVSTLKVAASATPHAEILEQCKELLLAENIQLEVVIFDDYILPNTATEDGEVDANYFQHTPYLEDFNSQNGTHIMSVGKIHYEPFGLYAGNSKQLDDLKTGGKKVAVPNDGTNEGRALKLLEEKGYLKLNPEAGFQATRLDIVENPYNIEIVELDAAQIPRSLPDVDFGIINGNYAIQVGLNASKDALLLEDGKEAIDTFANVLAVREGLEKDLRVQALLKVLQSEEIKKYVDEHFEGAVKLLSE